MAKQCNGIIKGWLHCLTSESKGRFLANNILYIIIHYKLFCRNKMSGIPIKNHSKKPQAFLKESETNLREIAQN